LELINSLCEIEPIPEAISPSIKKVIRQINIKAKDHVPNKK